MITGPAKPETEGIHVLIFVVWMSLFFAWIPVSTMIPHVVRLSESEEFSQFVMLVASMLCGFVVGAFGILWPRKPMAILMGIVSVIHIGLGLGIHF